MHPLLTQVPPNRLRSIIATFISVPASRTARDGPAWPVPITIASYFVAIGIPPPGVTFVNNFPGLLPAVKNYLHASPPQTRATRAQSTRKVGKNRTARAELTFSVQRTM